MTRPENKEDLLNGEKIMTKTLYLDTETTGTDCRRHGLVQLAMIVDIDGEIKAEKSWYIKPFEADVIDDEALEVNGLTMEQLKEFPAASDFYRELIAFLEQYVDKYDRSDKFYPAGFNVDFDMKFLKRFFDKCGDPYFGSWFNGKNVDPLPWLRALDWTGKISLPDYKLATVCEHYGIPLGEKAHDAMADIRATRELILRLRGMFS